MVYFQFFDERINLVDQLGIFLFYDQLTEYSFP